MPRRSAILEKLGLCPWFGLWPNLVGQSPYQGHSPLHLVKPSTAGRSPASHPAAEPITPVAHRLGRAT